MLDFQALVERYDEIVGERAAPPLLPDGIYNLMVTKAEAGRDHIYIHMITHTHEETRVRLMFTGNAIGITFGHLAGFGIGKDEMPAALADLAPMLVGRIVQAELGHWDGGEHVFQQIIPGTVRPI